MGLSYNGTLIFLSHIALSLNPNRVAKLPKGRPDGATWPSAPGLCRRVPPGNHVSDHGLLETKLMKPGRTNNVISRVKPFRVFLI
jgi:hypothetical protein